MTFPKGFLIGAATAAHQVEGGNVHGDFWAQEQMEYGGFAEPSLDAVDHYHHYEEDIRLLAAAGLNAYRFSIEWARIEPEKGRFDEAETAHYRDVLRCCRANGVEPIVTLHHFTSPKWLIEQGGWEDERTVRAFADYCAYVVRRLGQEMHYVCTINEANMGLQMAAISKRYLAQMMAAQKAAANVPKAAGGSIQVGMDLEKLLASRAAAAEENRRVFGTEAPQTFLSQRTEAGDRLILQAHCAARDAIKAICPQLKVGITLSVHDFQPLPGGEAEAGRQWEEEFTHYLPYIGGDDFVGIQNYTRTRIDSNGGLPAPEGAEITQMGYEFYPEALEHVLRRVAKDFHGDILVTENGVATADDTRRVAFIETALAGVQACLADGLPVKGYCYWSLLDNFEWQKGFGMTFGLVAVDRQNGQKRIAKPSLAFLGSCRAGNP